MTEADLDKREICPPEGDEHDELSLTAIPPDQLLSRYVAAIVERQLETLSSKEDDPKTRLELIRRILAAVSEVGSAALPPEDDPDRAPWGQPDTLVGSVRSEAQYAHCLRRGYYYHPASCVQAGDPSVRYVALCHAAYTDDPGIRWYGEVLRTAQIQRRVIPFPLTRNNPDEPYIAYVVKSWRPLPTPVEIRDGSVYLPRRTNSFLLTHAPYTCALFDIRSAEEYRVFMRLYRQFCGETPTAISPDREDGCLTLTCRAESATLSDRDGRARYTVTAEQFRRYPGEVIREISRLLNVNNL